MALETETLYPEPFMSENGPICCCCSIRGCVRDICTEYYDTGESEVYSEMIRSTFNINIAHDEQDFPHALCKQYICENCIVQLRNAHTFKIRVMKNHAAFLQRLTKWQTAGFQEEGSTKIHKIKSEWNHSDDDLKNDCEPKENEFKQINIKNESVLEGMIQSVNHQIGLIDAKIGPDSCRKRKNVKVSAMKSENKLNSSRKRNPEKEVNRRKQKDLDNIKKQQRTKNSGAAGTILRDNSLKLISNSTLWVFQWKGHGEYLCYICRQSYTDITTLKNHTKTHTLLEIEKKITNSSNSRVKVEISELFCKICNKKLDTLLELQIHLNLHSISINDHLLVPFKLNNENQCQLCLRIFKNFRLLKSHILKHYQSFVCEVCGAEFYKKEYLLDHITNRHTDLKSDKKILKFNCRICSTNFPTYPRKLEHMVENHGMKKPEFPCKLCPKIYIIKGLLNRHMKLTHLAEFKVKNYECDVCFKRFPRSHDVVRHKDTHSEGLNYSCGVCNHSFKLKTSLGRHMRRIHKQSL